MQNKRMRIGPIALTTTLGTNLVNCPTTTGGVNCGTPNTYLIISHLRIVNKSASPATFSLWLGATGANAAGTEVIGSGKSIAGNDTYDYYPTAMTMETTDFLVGGASANTALVMEIEAEIGLR